VYRILFVFADLHVSFINIQVPEDFRKTEENMERQAEDDV
jgi:hypothetical protein